MIDIDNIEDEIKEIVETEESENVSDFVLTTKNESTEMVDAENDAKIVEVDYSVMTEDEFSQDFDYVRNNLKDIVNQGSESLKHIISIASMSENPRAFEVVATLMKSLADINKDILATHKAKSDRIGETPSTQTNIQNNTVFVGSTAEFSKMMKDKINDSK